MFTRSNLKTPKLDIKKKTPQIAQSWEYKIEDPLIAQNLQKLEKNKWRTPKVDKNKIKEPQAHEKRKPLGSQNKIVKI